MIEITQEERWGLNALNSQTQATQAEFMRQTKAVEAYISLLELKYDATCNNGIFEKNEEPQT